MAGYVTSTSEGQAERDAGPTKNLRRFFYQRCNVNLWYKPQLFVCVCVCACVLLLPEVV